MITHHAPYRILVISLQAGIKNVTSDAAELLRGRDPDSVSRDLATHISGGGSASWTMYVQAVPEEEAEGYAVDIFDVTKVIP